LNSWRIFVHIKPKFTDHRGKSLEKEWRHAGLGAVRKVRAGQAYELAGELSREDAEKLAEVAAAGAKGPAGARRAEVWPKGGVSDPAADTVAMAARDLGFDTVKKVRSGAVYDFWGPSAKAVKAFCEDHLMNGLVQQVEVR
jgi:phosphoribosylformylglycinamidine (FGAM) synthase PurS component